MRLARAKTNLFLEVPARRPDGFHELDTVFVELDLADRLQAEPAEALELEVAGDAPSGPENLVLQAAAALRAAAGRPELGARLFLEKHIPSGGGLGGGSSDAAAALMALDALWGLGLGEDRLEEVAAELGSDVAFFVRGGLQRGRGRGELLEPLSPPPVPLHMVLVLPGFPCPTPQVYGALRPHLPARGAARRPDDLLEALAAGDLPAVGAGLFNRLQAAAFDLYPRLGALAEDLGRRPGSLGALLCGSGSTLLCLREDQGAAEELAADLRREGLDALATRTVTRGG